MFLLIFIEICHRALCNGKVYDVLIEYVYILQCDHRRSVSEHLYHIAYLFVVRIIRIYSLSNSEAYNTVLYCSALDLQNLFIY